jgi:hypothetical protein
MTLNADVTATFAHPRGTWLDPSTGAEIAQSALLRDLARRKVVLLGEMHTVYEIHRWQLHVATMLHALHPNIAIGFEMFPRATQHVLDDWVAGRFSSAAFLQAVDWPTVWGYDANLYLPLFHFCRQQRVRMLALNCHRPLVTRVGKEGWAAIPVEDRDGLTPAADATPAYRKHLFEIMGRTARHRECLGAVADVRCRARRDEDQWHRRRNLSPRRGRTAGAAAAPHAGGGRCEACGASVDGQRLKAAASSHHLRPSW